MQHANDPPEPWHSEFDPEDVFLFTHDIQAAYAGGFVYVYKSKEPCYVSMIHVRHLKGFHGDSYMGFIFVVGRTDPGVRAHLVTRIEPHAHPNPYSFVLFLN